MSETSASTQRRLLIVDDDPAVRALLSELCSAEGWEATIADSVASGRESFVPEHFDLVITDKNMPDGTGLDLIRSLDNGGYELPVILISADATLPSAVEALRLGVADYVFKPIESIDDFAVRIRRAFELRDLRAANRDLITSLREKNETLEAMAVRDPLTGLFNHAYFQESLEREIKRAKRNGLHATLLIIDLDHFKEVNDGLGHPVGDRLLTAFADLLLAGDGTGNLSFRLRAQDIAARYGGDEFAVVLPETTKAGAAVVAERMRQVVAELSFAELGVPPFTTSLGLAAFPTDAADRPNLIAAADAAMLAAKSLGRNRLVSYSADLRGASSDGPPIEEAQRLQALTDAIETDAFTFTYQPIVRIVDGELFAYEALCRPSDGFFETPLQLLRAAERAGRVMELGRALRRRAAEPLRRLPLSVHLFINLHAHELSDFTLVDEDDALASARDRIIFEVDDTVAQRNAERLRARIDNLRRQGFRIAVGGLEGGYASVDRVAAIAPDFLKIPRSLSTAHDRRSAMLLSHILEVAQSEGAQIIAEGIEDGSQAAAVAVAGIPLAQGFHFGRPMPL